MLDLLRIIGCGGLREFVKNRRHQLGCDNFYVHILGSTKLPTLCVTTPEDQASLMSKEGKLHLYNDVPDTFLQNMGPGNIMLLSGDKHKFHRKIFSSLMSPRMVENFVPVMLRYFRNMWTDLEQQNETVQVVVQDAICDAQFALMCEVFFGMTHDTVPLSDLRRLRKDFELQMESQFAQPNSEKFRRGNAASKRNATYLSDRFQKVLDACMNKEKDANGDHSHIRDLDSPLIGSAMESIADALIKENVTDDPEIRAEITSNLNFLLEASHSTTMFTTTSALYFLNHPDNRKALNKVREEVASIRIANAGDPPSVSTLKNEMTYTEACIKETMRLAPIIGFITYRTDEANEFQFKGKTLDR